LARWRSRQCLSRKWHGLSPTYSQLILIHYDPCKMGHQTLIKLPSQRIAPWDWSKKWNNELKYLSNCREKSTTTVWRQMLHQLQSTKENMARTSAVINLWVPLTKYQTITWMAVTSFHYSPLTSSAPNSRGTQIYNNLLKILGKQLCKNLCSKYQLHFHKPKVTQLWASSRDITKQGHQ